MSKNGQSCRDLRSGSILALKFSPLIKNYYHICKLIIIIILYPFYSYYIT